MADYNIIRLDQLPVASQVVVDSGQVLVVYNGSSYRATATLMKGPKGDKMVYTDLTAANIADLQKPAKDMIAQLQQTNTSVTQNETARTQAENQRNQTYEQIKTAEAARVQNETEREQQRQEAENAETERQQNEINRNQTFSSVETFFNQAKIDEQTRKTQEQERQTNTAKAIEDAEAATDRVNELSDNLPEIRNGYWWKYNETTKVYEDTGVIAHGNTLFATFDIDPLTGILTMATPDNYNGPVFNLQGNNLVVTIQ